MPQELRDKIVLVTGAGRRIGRAVALALGAQGAKVAVHYRSSADEARKTAAECGGEAFQADLSSVREIGRLFRQVHERFGRLDCLVNNAAIFRPMPILETTEEDWDEIQTSNLKQVYFCCQAAARVMLEQGGGRIVNMSSLGGIRPWAKYAPYNASKAGVIHMTKSLAKELAPKIQVNSVAPGVVIFDENPSEGHVSKEIAGTPMQTYATGPELAEAVLFFLTCPKYITGQVLAVDGGLSLKT